MKSGPQNLQIRAMTTCHLSELARLEVEHSRNPLGQQQLRMAMHRVGAMAEVFLVDGVLVGYGMAVLVENETILISHLKVWQDSYRLGIGEVYIQSLKSRIDGKDFKRLCVLVLERYLVEQQFYRACGLRALPMTKGSDVIVFEFYRPAVSLGNRMAAFCTDRPTFSD